MSCTTSSYIQLHASWSFCFNNIKVQIVSGLRITWCKEIVSQPPENIRLTAKAKPKWNEPH